ncbi:MAG: N-acylneuraminate cytidylyltransferase [Candidatus Giovannonibacteria bacterium GW2011_GWB1_45_9b]|uniref:Acylneuraminate cytidylyltransferase n=7 Tax=Candidatus Giovannoniibacteriota TaxID=1752738 RepID=A0A1F5X1U4_9BACT|nr:MAG: N-acylneuraminate cytidylyltransferase [Candidatus Giovannonibacteria bacterium GW2011_GWA2_44_26]KKT78814.1 MAG: N-acylneuraminate cytidylyltransferase [Candidatus Giovannonibacteria bacterium GW2011_GWC2_44_8]KKU16822.1 MAG: N-acylneuraminate cytidylyltransferase [Candidatus Giovannonibacteria bacterium GW2011_GWB1_45_9b]OGF73756.1 MAG: hypothetical protein A2W57_03185 [Candidatus Giovannonibacteria bacterium RIFCSPHIGHO2_02_43_16]OGF81830.1 MAG: hypothetical protein A2W48_00470 [Cand
MPKILGVVTARGGSKSIPGKNIKLLGGKPLISHIIESAKKSGIFDRLILSTDDEKIAEVAKKYGVEMLFLRPAELAQDATPHLPVIEHALAFMRDNEKYTPEYTAILQPTSPMVKPQDFIKAFELLKEKNADSVIGVVKIPPHYNPLRSLKTDSDGFLSLFVTGDPVRKRISRRQDLPELFTLNSAIYIFKTGLLFDPVEPSFYGNKVVAYVMDEKSSINIDDPEDWEEAEEAIKEKIIK